MSRVHRASWPAQAAALIAIALLTLASAQSVVMQALDAVPWAHWPICSAGPDKGDPRTPADKAVHQVCSVCAAASCPPLGAEGPRLAILAIVAWAPCRPGAVLQPRGPPSFRPKARGPPPVSPTV